MGLLEVNAQESLETPDPVTLPTGTEAHLEIATEPEIRSNDKGTSWLSVMLRVVEHSAAEIQGEVAPIFHSIFIPQEDDDPQRAAGNRRNMRDFITAFDIPTEGGSIEPVAAVGQQSWAVLKEATSEQYGAQNSVRKFIVGR